MSDRIPLPGELYLDAAVLNPAASLEPWVAAARGAIAQPDQALRVELPDGRLQDQIKGHGPFIALRWLLHPSLGVPLEAFTVWRRPARLREKPGPIDGARLTADVDTAHISWGLLDEMLIVELDVPGSASALGYSAQGEVVAQASGTGTLVLRGAPMGSVTVSGTTAVTGIRGLSVRQASNGAGWQATERVGLPVSAAEAAGTYYAADPQGPVGGPLDPRDAAIERMKRWSWPLGWMTLGGLNPWQAPDPSGLLKEYARDLLPGVLEIMRRRPPPELDVQQTEETVQQLEHFTQRGGLTRPLNTGDPADASSARTRPLSSLLSAAAVDSWASLALGFGTGAALSNQNAALALPEDDFMVTVPWKGRIRIHEETDFPWPFHNPLPAEERVIDAERELAAVALSPRVRPWPAAPSGLSAAQRFLEGAPRLDDPYTVATRLGLTRPAVLPERPRSAAYALARFGPDGPRYVLRSHPVARGWVPIGTAQPAPHWPTPPDPEQPAGIATLRDSGVLLPISGAPLTYTYAVAASDLFGRWSPWAGVSLPLGPAGVQGPGVSGLRAHAVAGPGDTDPCVATVQLDLSWDGRERRCRQLELRVDIWTPPAPPALVPASLNPPGMPDQPIAGLTRLNVTLPLGPNGEPPLDGVVPGLGMRVALDDGQTLLGDGQAPPQLAAVTTYRVTIAALSVTFGAATEQALSVYARATERVRPAEPSAWVSAREAAVLPDPRPPLTPPALPAVYPLWASLPDPAGFSRVDLGWAGGVAPAYQIFEASEAALRAACGLGGPVLTEDYASRMEALHALYRDPANRPKLRAAFRKLGNEPVAPPPGSDGLHHHPVLLPRGSRLIHALIVTGVTPANVPSSWPEPDAAGRRAFRPYAIPQPAQPARPEVVARLDAGGQVRLVVGVAGGVPARRLSLYRAPSAALARDLGTMTRLGESPTNPADWRTTMLTDPTPPQSWHYAQYRVVAHTDDDPGTASMAVASAPSKAYALLVPPDAPSLDAVPNVGGSTPTLALLAVGTPAPRATTDVGDHRLSVTLMRADGSVERHSSPLAGLEVFPDTATLAASSDWAGYVGTALYLRATRLQGEVLDVVLDLGDPLGRTAHLHLSVPALLPEAGPTLRILSLTRQGQFVLGMIEANFPSPPDPARPWILSLSARTRPLLFPPLRPALRARWDVAALTTVRQASDLTPPIRPLGLTLARLHRRDPAQVVFVILSLTPLDISLTLRNAGGETATAREVSP